MSNINDQAYEEIAEYLDKVMAENPTIPNEAWTTLFDYELSKIPEYDKPESEDYQYE